MKDIRKTFNDKHLGETSFELSQHLYDMFQLFDTSLYSEICNEVYVELKESSNKSFYKRSEENRGKKKVRIESVKSLGKYDRDNVKIYPKFSFLEILNLISLYSINYFLTEFKIDFKIREINGLTTHDKNIIDYQLLSCNDYIVVVQNGEELEFCEKDQDTLTCSLGYALLYTHGLFQENSEYRSQF